MLVLFDLNDFNRSNSLDRKATENGSILSRKLFYFEIKTTSAGGNEKLGHRELNALGFGFGTKI